jgi:hypothetical protein
MVLFLYLQIPHLRPAEYKRSRLSRNRRTVNRPYGGVLSGIAVRERWVNKGGYILKWKPQDLSSCSLISYNYSLYAESSVLSWLRNRRLSRRS